MKIDESLRICQDNEALIQKLGRFDEQTFNEARIKQMTEQEAKQRIQTLNQEVEKFPRKNRHSNEWFDKYQAKFGDLSVQADSVAQVELSIRDLLTQLNRQKQTALEDNFVTLSENFEFCFKRIVPGGSCSLKLVKTDANLAKSQPD